MFTHCMDLLQWAWLTKILAREWWTITGECLVGLLVYSSSNIVAVSTGLLRNYQHYICSLTTTSMFDTSVTHKSSILLPFKWTNLVLFSM